MKIRSLAATIVLFCFISIISGLLIREFVRGASFPAAVAQTLPILPLCDAWTGKPVMDFAHAKGLLTERLNNAPKLGEIAPHFTLLDSFTGIATSLSELHRDKAQVLYFASYSCHLAHETTAELKRLAELYKNSVDFVAVYIREAHPEGGYSPTDVGKQFVIPEFSDLAGRVSAAQRFATTGNLNFPVLVDSMDDAVAARWGAWPVRLFVIDKSGKVVFAGQQGPWFFKPTETYDAKIPRVPEGLRDLPGYSKESLEEFLQNSAKQLASAPREPIE